MEYKHRRYSGYIKPLFTLIDLIIIISMLFIVNTNVDNVYVFMVYAIIAWLVISAINHFYDIHRNTIIVKVITLLLWQIILFAIVLYAFIGFFKQPNVSRLALGNYLLMVALLVSAIKFLTYFLLKKYRAELGGNRRNVIVIGKNVKTRQLIEIFKKRTDFGFSFKKQFDVDNKKFSLSECFDFVKTNNIDEIYFSANELSNNQINKLIDFADNNLRELRFIPDNKDIFSKKLKYEYYDYIPILSLREIPLQDSINKYLKRGFDILFSSFIIIFILSWLTPLIAILIKLESRGPIFFKQTRNGFNYKEFDCYKFRSMTPNHEANLSQATRGDQRITKIGKFIRKTSIDELPQFFNVLFGDMSVVGPRPHMVSHTNLYAKRIDKFMVRHFVKPGITGLAQISGFRGEIETDKDIIGRVKFDIFYIENWSLLLDLKIIFQTARNAVKGEDKAY
jgi:putative colanic acid biosynthesis UDP-glucose lipid carrier transferase